MVRIHPDLTKERSNIYGLVVMKRCEYMSMAMY